MKFLGRLFLILLGILLLTCTIIYFMNRDVITRLSSTGPAIAYEEAIACPADEDIIADSTYSSEIDSARILLSELMKAYRIPGIAIAVAIDGELIWNEGFGCADISGGQPVNRHSLFRVGSVSKSMTGIALMKLQQDGKVDLNAKVQRYVPNFPEKEWPITVRQVANHQSGIRHYKGMEFLSNKTYDNVAGPLEIFQDDDLLHEPGSAMSYSSYNYTLLSNVIEKASGDNFLDYMNEQIFQPLNMTATKAGHKDDNFHSYSSAPGKNKVRKSVEVDLSNKWAAGGFLSKPFDLVNMLIHLDTLLTKETQALLFEKQKLSNSEETYYGIGFVIGHEEDLDKTLYMHGGSSRGGRAYLMKIVEDDIIIAICANSDTGMRPMNYTSNEVFEIAACFLEAEANQ